MKWKAAAVWRLALALLSGVAVALLVIAALAVVGSNASMSSRTRATVRDGPRRAVVFEQHNPWKVILHLSVLPVESLVYSGESAPRESTPPWRTTMMQRSDSSVIYQCIELGRPWPIATSQPTHPSPDGSWTSATPRWYRFGPLAIEWPGYVYWPGLITWIGVITAAWMLAWGGIPIARRRIRFARAQCVGCGYSLAEIPSDVCPECGERRIPR